MLLSACGAKKGEDANSSTNDDATSSASISSSEAADPYKYFNFRDNEDGTVTLATYSGEETTLTIPNEYKGKKVTAIGDGAFLNNQTIEHVNLPIGLLTIGDSAFAYCAKLIDFPVTPTTLTSIGMHAFRDCVSLSGVGWTSQPITKIGNYAYEGCTALKYVQLPKELATLGNGCFDGDYAIASISVNPGNSVYKSDDANLALYSKDLTTLYLYAKGATATSYAFLSSTKTVMDGAFEGSRHLETVTLDANVTDLSFGAFANCTALNSFVLDAANERFSLSSNSYYLMSKDGTQLYGVAYNHAGANITVPASVTYLKKSFKGDRYLSSVNLSNVTTIDEGTFDGCSGLNKIEFTASVSYVSGYAFKGCVNLNAIYVNGTNTTYACINYALYKGTVLSNLISKGYTDYTTDSSTTKIGTGAIVYEEKMDTLVINEGVTEIAQEAVCYCDMLVNLTLPHSLTSLPTNAFMGNAYLTGSVTYNGTSAEWMALTGSTKWYGSCFKADTAIKCTDKTIYLG